MKPLNLILEFFEKFKVFYLKIFGIEERKLKKYRKAIANLADREGQYIFPNSSANHAMVVMCNIFRTAKEYVYVFAGDLNGDVSKDEYIDELVRFMNRDNVELIVVLERKPQGKSDAVEAILKFRRENPTKKIKIGLAKDSECSLKLFNGQHRHFTISDDRMFRLELIPTKYIAQGSFNRPEIVGELKNKFTTIKFEEITETKDYLPPLVNITNSQLGSTN